MTTPPEKFQLVRKGGDVMGTRFGLRYSRIFRTSLRSTGSASDPLRTPEAAFRRNRSPCRIRRSWATLLSANLTNVAVSNGQRNANFTSRLAAIFSAQIRCSPTAPRRYCTTILPFLKQPPRWKWRRALNDSRPNPDPRRGAAKIVVLLFVLLTSLAVF